MVLHEEHLQRCSNSSSGGGGSVSAGGGGTSTAAAAAGGGGGGGKPCKKPKPKKIPQRGLGVAQLEKIRLEEQLQLQQQSNAGGSATSSYDFSSGFILPFPPSPPPPPPPPLQSSSSPAAPPTFSRAYDRNSTFRASSVLVPPPASLSGYFPPRQPHLPPIHALDGSIMASHGSSTTGNVFLPMQWNPSEFSLQDVEATQKWFSSPLPLDNESKNHHHHPIWGTQSPPPPWKRQRQQQPQPPPQPRKQLPSSPVNASVSPPSSGVHLQNELPSFQISCNEEKMVGTKRPWPPFLSDKNVPGGHASPFPPGSFPPPISTSFPRPHESLSVYGGRDTLRFEPGTTKSGEDVSCSTRTFQVDWRSLYETRPERGIRENNVPLDGDFLTLSPPIDPTSVAPPAPNFRQPTHPRHFRHHGSMDDAILQFGCSAQSSAAAAAPPPPPPPPPPFYSFLPMGSSSSQGTTANEQKCETGDDVNLDLAL